MCAFDIPRKDARIASIFNTCSAHGALARLSLHDQVSHASAQAFWHFRLCQGEKTIPMGWIVGQETLDEINQQLNGVAHNYARGFPAMLEATIESSGQRR